jgi:RecA-family ATPase
MAQQEIKTWCEKLLEDSPQEEWLGRTWGIIKYINATNDERLKARDLKKIFRASVRDIKNRIKGSKNNPDGLLHISSLLKLTGEPKWIIKDLLPENGIAILSGDPGSFKTWSTLHFAISIAKGAPVYDHFETRKGNVLIIDEEDGPPLLRKRAELLSADKKSNIYFMVMRGFKTDHEDQIDKLFRNIKKYKIKVVIIDSLVRIHLGDENSSKDIARVFEVLRRLNTKGITVLLNHHNRKKSADQKTDRSSMRGSSDILAAIDCHLQIERRGNQLIISQTKNRNDQELKPFAVNFVSDEEKMVFTYAGEDTTPQHKSDEAQNQILKILTDKDDWLDRAEIDNQLNGKIGKNNIGTALRELADNNEIEVATTSKGKKKYRIDSS